MTLIFLLFALGFDGRGEAEFVTLGDVVPNPDFFRFSVEQRRGIGEPSSGVRDAENSLLFTKG